MACRLRRALALHQRWAQSLTPHSGVMVCWALGPVAFQIRVGHTPNTRTWHPSSSVLWCLGGPRDDGNLPQSGTRNSTSRRRKGTWRKEERIPWRMIPGQNFTTHSIAFIFLFGPVFCHARVEERHTKTKEIHTRV